LDGIGCPKCNVQIKMLKYIGDASYYWAEVSESYPFFCYVELLWGIVGAFVSCLSVLS